MRVSLSDWFALLGKDLGVFRPPAIERVSYGRGGIGKQNCAGFWGVVRGLRMVGGLYGNGFSRLPNSNARRVAKVCGPVTKNPQLLGDRPADGAALWRAK